MTTARVDSSNRAGISAFRKHSRSAIPTSFQAIGADNYTFYIASDDGARVYLDGVLIIGNSWLDQGNTERGWPRVHCA